MKNASKFAILLAILLTIMMLPLVVSLVSGGKGAAGGGKADAIHAIRNYTARTDLALRELGEGAATAADDDEDEADSGLEMMRDGVLKIFRSVGLLSDEEPKDEQKNEQKKDPTIAHARPAHSL